MPRFRRGDKPRPGPPETHGGHAEVRKYRERKLDLRCRNDKALIAWQHAICDDLHGQVNMDMLQMSLLDRATECLIVLRAISEYVEANGIMGEGGVLVPALRNSFLAYQNSFRLALLAIYERADKRPPKPLNLDDYIESKHTKGEAK